MTIRKTTLQRTMLAAIGAVTLGIGITPSSLPPAQATTTFEQYSQSSWRTTVHMARLTNNADQLVMQVDVQDKPVTTYANAVYSLYAYHNRQWVQVYTNTGARLIRNERDRLVLSPEVIDCRKVQRESGIDLQTAELKAVVSLRYDSQSGRDQMVQFEQRRWFSEIAQVASAEIVQLGDRRTTTAIYVHQQSSSFNLAIAGVRNQSVTARISVKPANRQIRMAERLLGDYRYEFQGNQQVSNLISGVQVGDRIAVRLFDSRNQLMGQTEFELQTLNSWVTLVLAEEQVSYGGVRVFQGETVGVDDHRSPKPKKFKSKKSKHNRHGYRGCNQGRGNGPEGCDPGRSRSRHGSNDGDD
ncbi:MAG: hypothetical protein RLZZ511_2891 [Cyanobacteriota bacterium]